MYSAFGTDPEKHVFGVLKWLGPSSWKIRAHLFRIVGAVVAYAIATQGTIVFYLVIPELSAMVLNSNFNDSLIFWYRVSVYLPFTPTPFSLSMYI